MIKLLECSAWSFGDSDSDPSSVTYLLRYYLNYLNFSPLLQAYGEENYHALQAIAETLEKKDGGDVNQWKDTMKRYFYRQTLHCTVHCLFIVFKNIFFNCQNTWNISYELVLYIDKTLHGTVHCLFIKQWLGNLIPRTTIHSKQV